MSAPNQRPLALFSTNPAEELLSGEDWSRVATLAGLTLQEMKVAVCLFESKTRPQIAEQLQCAERTVRFHIERLFAKLNVRDRLSLAQRIIRIHLDSRDLPT
jgi:DNA-binding NarL/FixJ family response regulator